MLILINLAQEKSLFASHLLALSLLDLLQILEEKHCVFVAVICPRKNVPSDTSRPTNLVFFIAKENFDLIVLEFDDVA